MESLADFLRDTSLSREGINTIPGAKYAAYLLFCLIDEHHGRYEARRIFRMWGIPPTKRQINEIKNLGLLDRYDLMQSEPNVQRLASQLADENKKLPQDQRHGPRGTTNPVTLDKHIRRLIKERKKRRKRGRN
jgi:hypothetical protein